MIFYFSGTGNSRLAAKQVAESIGDVTVSINRCLKENSSESFFSAKPFIFVTPTYAWRMPRAVKRWIAETQFKGADAAYFILTCGGSTGNAAAYLKKLCKQKNWRFLGLGSVVMPENYVAMFDTPTKNESIEILNKAAIELEEIAARIVKGEKLDDAKVTLNDRFSSGLVNALYYPLIVRDKGFKVSDKCVFCGKCAKRCPLNNITVSNGKPVWNGDCTHCMACIGGCPVEAIEYQTVWGNSKNKPRYYINKDE